jgi:hypothetical protein
VCLVTFFFLPIDLKTNISLVHRSAPAPASSQVLVTQIQYTDGPTSLFDVHQPAFIQNQPKLTPCSLVSNCAAKNLPTPAIFQMQHVITAITPPTAPHILTLWSALKFVHPEPKPRPRGLDFNFTAQNPPPA